MATFDEWQTLAGEGSMDDRASRTTPPLRVVMGIAPLMPRCLLCRRQVSLVDSDDPEPPRWMTLDGRNPVCGGGSLGYPPGEHRVAPLARRSCAA